ncbi:hypothetical protein VTO73DRAFT_6079 [Trametes versicolor]
MSAGSNSTIPAAAVLAAKDQAIWVPRNIAYTHQLWWFVASFIGLIAAGNNTNTVGVGQTYTFIYAEVCITVGYIAALFTWEFANTTGLAGSALTFGYWSGRAAALSVSQLPLLTALGTKNSILAYITGVSYDKLNFFHRMVARVIFILLWVHASSKHRACVL